MVHPYWSAKILIWKLFDPPINLFKNRRAQNFESVCERNILQLFFRLKKFYFRQNNCRKTQNCYGVQEFKSHYLARLALSRCLQRPNSVWHTVSETKKELGLLNIPIWKCQVIRKNFSVRFNYFFEPKKSFKISLEPLSK